MVKEIAAPSTEDLSRYPLKGGGRNWPAVFGKQGGNDGTRRRYRGSAVTVYDPGAPSRRDLPHCPGEGHQAAPTGFRVGGLRLGSAGRRAHGGSLGA